MLRVTASRKMGRRSNKPGFFLCAMTTLIMFVFGAVAQRAAAVVVGVNVVNADHLSVAQQDDMLKEIRSAGVTVIRSGIPATDEGVEFARRAYAMGLRIDWIVSFMDAYQADAPTRAYQKSAYPNMWGGHPLSALDPDLFRTRFASMLARLDSAGVKLEAMEIGNEINMAGFNPDFPVPGENRQFGLADLARDSEARQVGEGYLQYLKVLSQVKDVRDHAGLNRATPILTAGFGVYEGPEGPLRQPSFGLVSINATLDFMRAHGLDQWVDGYAVHVYPWSDRPGDPAAAAGRQHRLAKYALTRCQPAGSNAGKPCWITEWGFKLRDTACPVNDDERKVLIREMMRNFKPYVENGRLRGLIYFGWNTDPWAKSPDPLSLNQCGTLTASGRQAIDPSLLQ